MDQITLQLTGIQPLMVNNPQTVNPFNEFTKQIKELTGKRKRTDQDESDLMKLKWFAALYYDQKVGPFLPAICVWRSLQDAAKLSRAGKMIERGLHMLSDRVPIVYRGSRDPEEMYSNKVYVDIRDAAPGGKRITAVRPIFPEWSVEVSFLYDSTTLNRRDLLSYAELAGRVIGVGTYRRLFGRFEVEAA